MAFMEFVWHTPYGEYAVKACIEEYAKGGKGIRLVDQDDGSPIATATVWVPGIPEGCVAVKDYSENEGVLDALIAAGIVSEPIAEVATGFVVVPICKLLV